MRIKTPATFTNILFGFSLLAVHMVGATAENPILPAFDYSEVTVEFKVKVLGVLPITGQFRDVRGGYLNTGSSRNTEFGITICLYSLDTQDAERDRLLRSPVFFDVERFPAIHFNDVRLDTTDKGERRLLGDLTLRGVSQPVAFRLTEAAHENKDSTGGAGVHAARTTIKRSAFGLDAFPLIVSDEVDITVYVHGDLEELVDNLGAAAFGDRLLTARTP